MWLDSKSRKRGFDSFPVCFFLIFIKQKTDLIKYLVCEDKVLYTLQLSDWLGADLQNLLDEFESHIGVMVMYAKYLVRENRVLFNIAVE